MLALRPMHLAEFPGYLAYFIPDYAAELVESHGLPLPDAVARARREIAEDLPEGAATPGQDLLCITGGAETLGYLWLQPDLAAGSAFIMDFHILPTIRARASARLPSPFWKPGWPRRASPACACASPPATPARAPVRILRLPDHRLQHGQDLRPALTPASGAAPALIGRCRDPGRRGPCIAPPSR